MPITGILSGALVWGLIWYPYRALYVAGVSGPMATMISYLLALLCSFFILTRVWPQLTKRSWWVVALILSAGWANFGYVLAVLNGEVMRVLLLFYLAPLWTILFSYFLLGERLDRYGYIVIALSFSGAVIMLWRPQLGMPLPQNISEWMGLTAGMSFALSNVVSRRAEHLSVIAKSNSALLGTVLLTSLFLWWQGGVSSQFMEIESQSWLLLVLLAIVLFSTSFAVQYGLSILPANRVIILFLFELVFAAFASYFLADELMELWDWAGAALIISASLLSGQLHGSD
jgi:drug/metabolite transporter (DMT)-like permease